MMAVWPYPIESCEDEILRATREIRQKHLELLEQKLPTLDPNDEDHWHHRYTIESEIKRLRRQLGIKGTPEEKRAKTRERVRRHRERKKKDTAVPP